MFDAIMNFIVDIIFWGVLIFMGLLWLFGGLIGIFFTGTTSKTSKSRAYNKPSQSKNTKTKYTTSKQTTSWDKSFKLPGVHEDYDEELRKELIKEGKYDSYNFDEEDLEEDDYHYEDDN